VEIASRAFRCAFLESQPYLFAVFTNDEVARVAAMGRPKT